MRKYLYLDFEFNQSSEATLNLVCAVTLIDSVTRKWWLHHDEDKEELKEYLLSHKDKVFVAYGADTEARCCYDLGLNAHEFKWVCLYIEYKMFSNHNSDINSGLQLIKGEVKRTFVGEVKSEKGLIPCAFKLLKVRLDSKYKDKMRDLILSNPEEFSEEEKKDILKYCESDVFYLPRILKAINKLIRKYLDKKDQIAFVKEALQRGKYACLTGKMVKIGYPVNREWAENLRDNIPSLFDECARDINSQFENIRPFRFQRLNAKYSMNTIALKEWVKEQKFKDWLETDSGDVSLSLKAWSKYFSFSHDYPRGNLAAQIIRYLKLKQATNGFTEPKSGSDRKKFWDYLGSDGRVRPHMGIYVAQSSRSQPAATGFVFLKPAWQRSMVQPKPGRAICGIDYSSEEFLLSGLESKDKKMIKAYASGDAYLAFAKDANIVPQDATKKTHKYERDICKGTVLGISYMMSKIGLAIKLTQDTGRYVNEDEAQEYIDKFNMAYPVFNKFRERFIEDYGKVNEYVKLKDGWIMFGDNPNPRSVGNFPIQGMGAVVMRKAVELAYEKGLDVIFTLHDAIYIEYDSFDFEAINTLYECMFEAFIWHYKGTEMEEYSRLIRMEGETWSPDYDRNTKAPNVKVDLKIEKIHIDERAVSEFNRFNRYMKESNGSDLLT